MRSASLPFDDDDVCEEIALRLLLIVRYNVLSIETCSELLVYPDVNKGGMASLAGTGLYGPEVSYFNHSCVPNVSSTGFDVKTVYNDTIKITRVGLYEGSIPFHNS